MAETPTIEMLRDHLRLAQQRASAAVSEARQAERDLAAALGEAEGATVGGYVWIRRTKAVYRVIGFAPGWGSRPKIKGVRIRKDGSDGQMADVWQDWTLLAATDAKSALAEAAKAVTA